MSIQMIVTDLDRTLLRADKSISDYTADILRRCQKEGIRIVFATARPKRAIDHYLKQVNCDGVICHNGAVMCIGEAECRKYSIPIGSAREIIASVLREWPDAKLSVEINETLFANFDVSVLWENVTAIQTNFTDLPDQPVDKVIVSLPSPEAFRHIEAFLPRDVYAEISEGVIAMILDKQATKLNGIIALAENFHIDLSRITAFGDDTNDLSMILKCGTGVAVSNALDAVKAAADFICDTNDNDGVARWLEENILYKRHSN